MQTRMKHSRSERNSVIFNPNNRKEDNMFYNFTSKGKNEIPMISGDSYNKLRALMVPASQSRAVKNDLLERFSHHNHSLNNSKSFVSFEKAKSPTSQFYINPRINGPAPRQLSSIEHPEQIRAHSRYRSRKHNSQSQENIVVKPGTAQANISLTQFTFNIKPKPSEIETSSFSDKRSFFRSNNITPSQDFTRPSTHANSNFPRTPSTMNAFDFNNSSFRKDLGTPGSKKANQVEGFGGFRKRPIFKSGAESKISSISEVKEEIAAPLPVANATQKNFWVKDRFVVNNDVPTKNKMKVKAIEQGNIQKKKLTENERIIIENKQNIMVCLDDENRFEQVKYCFVSRNIDKPNGFSVKHGSRVDVEFNIKLTEIRKKLGISLEYRFMYLLNGSSIFDFEKIPVQENVILVSKRKEIESIEGIMDHELIRDFYEYGCKQGIKIYSKSHIKSRMNSILEAGQEMERKYHEILTIFEQGNKQVNSEDLARLVVAAPKNPEQGDFGYVFQAFKEEEEDNIPNEIHLKRVTSEAHTLNGSLLSANKSQMDKIITLGSSDALKSENEKEIEAYVQDTKPLTGGEKFKTYKEIINHYKSLQHAKMVIEEPDDQFATHGVTEEDEETKHAEKIADIGGHLDVLLKRFKRPRKKIDYLDLKKELENSNNEKSSYRSMRSQLAENMQIDKLDENKFERPAEKPKEEKVNIIDRNIKALNTKKQDIDNLHKMHRELFSQNIPKQLSEKKFTRKELHFVYTLYKALCEVTSQRYKEYNFEDGIDYHSFRNGIYQIFLQSEELAEKIFYTIDFNFSGFLNWDEFLDAMQIIRAKTMREKIDLFIKIADQDKNGHLSKEEIFSLAKVCLGKFIQNDQDGFLDDLCEYFTKLIFNSIGIDTKEEIPLQSIKQAILSRSEESQLLAMFCGADI